MKYRASLVVLSLLTATAHAEHLYVSDKLVVNVYAEASQESDKLATLESGDAVEGTDKTEGFTRVKLADGREGWIRSSYLSAQIPAIVRVKELERGTASSSIPPTVVEELKQLKERNASLHSEVQILKQAASTPASAPVAPVATPQTVSVVKDRAGEPSSMHALKWGAVIALAASLLGYALGYRNIARRIERKYGKLKIY